ncbi:MAG: alpha/beta fold hydrolase [Burkholderiales bacterium]|nr:alpha/beta fold hydrolase [Burkholderiales bacterium]
MLARLLRLGILLQVLTGAAVGLWLLPATHVPLWWALAGAALFPLVTTVLVNLYSALRSRADEPAAQWWSALFGEIIAGVHIFLLRQPWTVAPPAVLPATGANARVPVVLVHGYLCNHRTWDDIASDLRAQGHTVLAVNLEPLFTSIDNYAVTVEAAVDALCRETGSAKVALVGHSMGGLAIRAWMRAHGTARVARVLTLGTPHAGTQIATGTQTPNGRQMQWHSRWLAELSAGEADATRALIRIALTPQDNIVYPQRAQVLPGLQATVFKGIGHLQMCLDPAVIAWVREQLSDLPAGARP